MNSCSLSERELDIVTKSLRAAADGEFFPEWEFETLIGATRSKIRSEADAWRSSAGNSLQMRELALSVISNLLGYPHDRQRELEAIVGASSKELDALMRKLST
jgi:hypothetical protein